MVRNQAAGGGGGARGAQVHPPTGSDHALPHGGREHSVVERQCCLCTKAVLDARGYPLKGKLSFEVVPALMLPPVWPLPVEHPTGVVPCPSASALLLAR